MTCPPPSGGTVRQQTPPGGSRKSPRSDNRLVLGDEPVPGTTSRTRLTHRRASAWVSCAANGAGWIRLGDGHRCLWVVAAAAEVSVGTTGEMVTGWVQVDGSWYYMGTSGQMVTGWVQIDGGLVLHGRQWHDGHRLAAQGSSWKYYMGGSGAMVTGTQVVGVARPSIPQARWAGHTPDEWGLFANSPAWGRPSRTWKRSGGFIRGVFRGVLGVQRAGWCRHLEIHSWEDVNFTSKWESECVLRVLHLDNWKCSGTGHLR